MSENIPSASNDVEVNQTEKTSPSSGGGGPSRNILVYILAVAVLVLGAGFAWLLVGSSDAVEIGSTVSIVSSGPVVEAVDLYDQTTNLVAVSPIIPPTNSSLDLSIKGVVHDPIGENYYDTVRAVFYRRGVDLEGVTINANCTSDKNYCYQVPCTLTSRGDGTRQDYSCPFSLSSWADSTTISGRYPNDAWVAEVFLTNNDQLTATKATIDYEVDLNLGVSLPDSIVYGSRELGSVTTALDNYDGFVISQVGNAQADVYVTGSDMVCSGTGSIPVSSQRWSLTDVGYDSLTTSNNLTINPQATNLNLPYRDLDATGDQPQKILYWDISIPTTGLSGDCSGTNVVTFGAAFFETGQAAGSVVVGLDYEVRDATNNLVWSGQTDNNGYFTYANSGDKITFLVGEVQYGILDTASLDAVSRVDRRVYPQDLVGVGRDSLTNTQVVKMMQFLQSLDVHTVDGQVIKIDTAAKEKLRNLISTNYSTFDSVSSLVLLTDLMTEAELTDLVVTQKKKTALKTAQEVNSHLVASQAELSQKATAAQLRLTNSAVEKTAYSAPNASGVSTALPVTP